MWFDQAFPFQNSFTANFRSCAGHWILNWAGAMKKRNSTRWNFLDLLSNSQYSDKKELYGDFKEILYFEREVKSEISTYVEGLQVHVKFHCTSRFQVLSRWTCLFSLGNVIHCQMDFKWELRNSSTC